jgi:hypothetical protein
MVTMKPYYRAVVTTPQPAYPIIYIGLSAALNLDAFACMLRVHVVL